VQNLQVTGNLCPRGEAYAQEEIRNPKRMVTATAAIILEQGKVNAGFIRRVPVRTTVPCPREKIPSLLRDIYKLKVSLPVKTGDVLIANWKNEGFDIIATRRIG